MMYELDDDHMDRSDLFLKAEAEFFFKKTDIVMRYIVEKGYVTENKASAISYKK